MEFSTILLALAALFLRLAVSETSEEFLLRHQNAREDGLAPLYGTDHDSQFPNEYIAMFEPGYTLEQHFESIGMDLSDSTRFKSFSYGYRARLDDVTLNSHVRRDSGVLLVDTNRPVGLVQPIKSSKHDSAADDSAAAERQKRYTIEVYERQAPYGLQMLSGAEKLPTPVRDDGKYHYQWGAGEGVNVYVFDTG